MQNPQSAADIAPPGMTPNLLGYLRHTFGGGGGGGDLTEMDPMGSLKGHKGHLLARTRTLNVRETYWEGSPSQFQEHEDAGTPIAVNVAAMLGADLERRTLPRRNKAKDRAQNVTPKSYDLGAVYINSITIANPTNTTGCGVGVSCNALPPAYTEMRAEQTRKLREEMGLKWDPGAPDLIAHIPAHSADPRQIPIIKEVANGYHATEVTKTFGGLTTKHLWTGVVSFTPEQAEGLGLPPPPRNHEAGDPPAGVPRAHNSWAVVPMGHVFSHIASMASSEIKHFDYCVHQLQMPNGANIPFLLMDLWTLHRYAGATVQNALLKMGTMPLRDVAIRIHPLTGRSWTEACRAGEANIAGRISCSVLIRYTMFPRGCADNPLVLPTLSDNFPRVALGERDAVAEHYRDRVAEMDDAEDAIDTRDRLREVIQTAGKGKDEEDDDDDHGQPMPMDQSALSPSSLSHPDTGSLLDAWSEPFGQPSYL